VTTQNGKLTLASDSNFGLGLAMLQTATPTRWASSSYTAQTTTGVITLPSNPIPGGAAAKAFELVVEGTGGMLNGSPIYLQFNSDTGNNYLTFDQYGQGSLSSAMNAPGGAPRSALGIQCALTASTGNVLALGFKVRFCPLKARGPQIVRGRFESKASSADTAFIGGNIEGCYDQTANDITSFKINFGAAFTGVVDIYGFV
jgi:hypothetical protein